MLFTAGATAGVLAQVGPGDGKQAVRPDRRRAPDHQRAVHDRPRRHAAAHRVQAQPRLLGARPRRAARPLQLRPRRLPHVPGPRRSRARRSRPASSTSSRSTARARGCASTRARSGATAASSRRPFETEVGQGLQSYQLNLRRPIFQDIRVREALGYTYDFETHQPLQAVQAREQRVQQLGRSPPGPAVARRVEAARAVSRRAAAARVRPGVRRAAHRRRPERAAPQPAEGARAVRAGRLEAGARRQAAQRARARRSSSSTCNPGEGRRNTDWERNLDKLGITLQGAQRRLRAVPAPARDLRLRRGHDRRGRLHVAERRRPRDQLRQQVGRRAGQQQLPRRQEPGGRPADRGDRPARRRSTSCATPRARSTAS